MHSLPYFRAIFARALHGGTRLLLLGSLLAAAPLFAESTPPAARNSAKGAAAFSAAVNWDFQRLEKLDAWQSSALVIRRTLAEWYPAQVSGPMVENTDRAGLRGFFAQTAKLAPENWRVVYLASHQTAAGYWHFPHDTAQSWSEILAGAPAPAKAPQCVIVDACFAEAADQAAIFEGTGALGVLYAASRAEVVHELNFHRRFPIDLTRRYAAEAKWLNGALGSHWSGRVSFLGFVWLHAWLATPHPPQNTADWTAFFHACENVAAEFRHGRGEGLASTVHFVARPEVPSRESISSITQQSLPPHPSP